MAPACGGPHSRQSPQMLVSATPLPPDPYTYKKTLVHALVHHTIAMGFLHLCVTLDAIPVPASLGSLLGRRDGLFAHRRFNSLYRNSRRRRTCIAWTWSTGPNIFSRVNTQPRGWESILEPSLPTLHLKPWRDTVLDAVLSRRLFFLLAVFRELASSALLWWVDVDADADADAHKTYKNKIFFSYQALRSPLPPHSHPQAPFHHHLHTHNTPSREKSAVLFQSRLVAIKPHSAEVVAKASSATTQLIVSPRGWISGRTLHAYLVLWLSAKSMEPLVATFMSGIISNVCAAVALPPLPTHIVED
ncbi:hypothetical protein F5Y12DRAFT_716453 [Xylaria sp. FL1777]|nr:hypothetical protein F5Y12DRAFT_716453 [Xylaria sp. FL1777]